ncbi:MAG: hypothetical protein LBF57_01970 [Holosporaceae bacterium]|nr:hypothetical protein [Holosporaceae bacterium]
MSFFKGILVSTVIGCFSFAYAGVYEIESDTNGKDVRLVKVCSLGIQEKHREELTGPLFRVKIDSLRCSQMTPEKFVVECDGRVVAYIVFGQQITTLDPLLELADDKGDINVELMQNGASGSFRLIVEPKVATAPSTPRVPVVEGVQGKGHLSDGDAQ